MSDVRVLSKAWEDANGWERRWWGDCLNTAEEESKQQAYAEAMGIDFDLGGKRVLDVGGGPVSLLLKTSSRGADCTVLDPVFYPGWTVGRYNDHGIRVVQLPAEQFRYDGGFDEVWMYNVLQHVDDPCEVLQYTMALAPVVRIFEWVDIPIYQGHLHVITQQMLEEALGVQGEIVTPAFCTLNEKAWAYGGPVKEVS